MLLVLMDFSEESALLRTVIDNLPDSIYVKDTHSRFILNNKAHLSALGAQRQEDVLGKTDFDFFSPEIAQRYFNDEQEIIRTGQPLLNHEQPRVDKAGHQQWVIASKLPWRNAAGTTIGILGISRDITARKLAEQLASAYAQELREKNQQMKEDLEMARELQQAFLPAPLAQSSTSDGRLRFFHRYQPSQTLGGDFFDIIELTQSKTGVLVCDVMGHGVRAALVTAILRALVGELAPMADNPGQFLASINHALLGIMRQTKTPTFATAFYLVADVGNGELRFANAGHPNPLRVGRDQALPRELPFAMRSAGPALGLFENATYVTQCAPLADHNVIVLYTDGIFEVDNQRGEQYGRQRLRDTLDRLRDVPAAKLLDELLTDVRRHSGRTDFPDDVCLLAMEVI